MELFTERLRISKYTPADAPFIYRLLNSPLWLKYIGNRGIRTHSDALRYLEERVFPAYEKSKLAGWRVALSATDEPIGSCGFYQRDHLEHPDFGFAFAPEFIGKGYGYEAGRACLDYGIRELGVTDVLAFTTQDNVASIGLLTKLGFVDAGVTHMPGDEQELRLFKYAG